MSASARRSEQRTLRGKAFRNALWLAADGKCQICGRALDPSLWHADHVLPWSKTGRTNVHEMQALCPRCNLRKGKRGMKPRGFFRRFRQLLPDVVEKGDRSATALVECGGGKSTIPPAAAYDLRRMGIVDSIVWLVPRTSLAIQAERSMNCADKEKGFVWRELLGVPTKEALTYRINALLDGNPVLGVDPAAKTFGYACSFNAVVSNLFLHQEYMRHRKVLLVADEVQLCESGERFGTALEELKAKAAFFLAMSGDFDRPDRSAVAAVEYEPHDEGRGLNCQKVKIDLEYNIYDALNDRAIIPLDFCYGQGSIEFTKNGESVKYGSIEQVLSKHASDAVCCAIAENYGDELLLRCVKSWRGHRTTGRVENRIVAKQPRAQLLVVCATQDQARRIRRLLVETHGVPDRRCGLAISDNFDALNVLTDFTRGKLDALVTVAMAYIGMDAPLISHLCCLTSYRSPAWLHQMLARAWRVSPDVSEYRDQYAVCFAPNDPKWQKAIESIRKAQQIGTADKRETDSSSDGIGDGEPSTDHWGQLHYTENRFEITVENPWLDETDQTEISHEHIGTATVTEEPDVQCVRETLLNLGLDSYRVEAMIAAMDAPVIEDPVTDERSPREIRKQLANELHDYQKQTTHLYAARHGRKATGDDYKHVNKELVKMCGWKSDQRNADERKLRECLNVFAPRLRRRLVGDA